VTGRVKKCDSKLFFLGRRFFSFETSHVKSCAKHGKIFACRAALKGNKYYYGRIVSKCFFSLNPIFISIFETANDDKMEIWPQNVFFQKKSFNCCSVKIVHYGTSSGTERKCAANFGPGIRVARFFLTQYTKTRENIPNYHNITKWP
jgi:hypothetical protein